MKSKRIQIKEDLAAQVRWAEQLPDSEIASMLLDGESKTICGCSVVEKEVCPHGNMGALYLLMFQLTKEDIEKKES